MKRSAGIAASLALTMLAACATPQGQAGDAPAPETAGPETAGPETAGPETAGLLTLLTSGDAETQLMALVLTRSAMAAGERPRILLCSQAGDLALATPPDAATAPLQPQGRSPQDALKGLMAAGVEVDVCAIYLPNRPFGAEALLEGVGVARPDNIGSMIASPDIRLLSF